MSVGIFAVKLALGPVLLPRAKRLRLTDIPVRLRRTEISVRPELVEGPAAQ
jgi:hypothetical protein